MMNESTLAAGILWIVATGCGHGHEHGERERSGAEETGAVGAPLREGGDAHEPEGEDAHARAHAAADLHGEVPLGSVAIGEFDVLLAQGHGPVEAGHEGHLVVKLPYTDHGATTVRAWIGTDDRTLSFVGKGHYSEESDDYDVHATAPVPLPDEPWWWIELEPPSGEKLLGFARPILE